MRTRSWLLFGLSLSLVVPFACNGDPKLTDGDCSGAACGGAANGESCDDDDDCGSLATCQDDVCSSACNGDDDCKEGATCSSSGQCQSEDIVVGGDGDNGSGASGGEGGANNCVDQTVDFEPEIPTVLIVIDQSSSMTADFGAGMNPPTRWESVKTALLGDGGDADDVGIIGSLEDEVRFGIQLYSATRPAGGFEPGECIDNNSDAPDLSNYDDIATALDDEPYGGTPTEEAFRIAAATLAGVSFEGPKVIVLATDGDPDTCNQTNTSPAVREAVVDAVEEAYQDADITTFVISVANEVDTAHLVEVANVGQGIDRSDEASRYFPANDPGALADAFQTIIDGQRSCIFELDGEVPDGKESLGTVTLDGVDLELDGDNGWRMNTPSELELLGSSCETILSGDRELSIVFPCDVIIPVVR